MQSVHIYKNKEGQTSANTHIQNKQSIDIIKLHEVWSQSTGQGHALFAT